MPKILFCGKGGSGKSTLLALLSLYLSEHHDVLVVDADESNPGLARMMGLDAPRQTLMESLGGKTAFRRSMGKKTAALEKKDPLGGALRSMAALPSSAASRSGRLTLVSIGKIEHAHEGCACPMGVLARTFIGNISIQPGQWALIDTEAGVEHFGRGVLEGVDAVVAVADPSYDAVMLIGKIKAMADEGSKRLCVVLNKTDGDTEPLMRTHLGGQGIRITEALPQSRDIAAANLRALPLDVDPYRENLRALLEALETPARQANNP
jgi:CO dehydrogenase maturation factor